MKNVLKWISILLLSLITLLTILALLLYFPPVQNWVVKQVASYASEKTGMEISVEHVNLEFPLDLGLENVKVIQQNDSLPQVKDTIADIEKTVVDVQLLPLFRKQVMIDDLDFKKLKVNTASLVHSMRFKGSVGHLNVKSHGVGLDKENINVNNALLSDARISIELSDTVPEDTTPSTNFWKLNLAALKVKNTDFTLHMPGDTLSINAFLGKTSAQDGFMDFNKGLYQINHLDWKNGRVKYDNNFKVRVKGLDANHIFLDSLNLVADSFYFCKSDIRVKVLAGSFKEQGMGLRVNALNGPFAMDSTRLYLPDLYLKTPTSELKLKYIMDMNAFADKDPGKMLATVHGTVGKPDLLLFMDGAPKPFLRKWPNQPLAIDGSLNGNLEKIFLEELSLRLPTAFNVKVDGWAEQLLNTDKLGFNVDLDAHTYNLGFVTAMLDPALMKQIRIPSGIGVKGKFKGKGPNYQADFTAREGGGSLRANATIDIKRMAYKATATASALAIQHFVPNQGLHPFTGYVKVDGVGTDVFSPRTHLNATAKVQKFAFDKYSLDNMNAVATIANGKAHAKIDSKNSLLKGLFQVDALMNTKNLQATVSADLGKADLYHLRLVDSPLLITLCGHVDVSTNMKDYYKVQGLVSDMTIVDKDSVYHPTDVVLDILTRKDTTHAVVDCGDFHLNMNADTGYEHLMKSGNGFVAELQKQMKERVIDQAALRKHLPNICLLLQTGKYNFISSMIAHYGYTFKHADIDMDSSPIEGLNGKLSMDSLVLIDDSIRIDTIRLKFASNNDKMAYEGYVRNTKENTPTFTAKFNGGIVERGAFVNADIYDQNDRLGLQLPIIATMEREGIRAQFSGSDLILGYKKFSYNKDNYVLLKEGGRVLADLKLKAADGQGIQVYSDSTNVDALQDITVGLHKFNLDEVLSVIPYAPKVSGIMNGDFHAIQTKEDLSVSSDIAIANMAYEGCKMGNLETQFVYMPKSDGTHQVDGILLSESNVVGTVKGTYKSEGDGYLDAKLNMDKMPMQIVNGFIPDRIIGLRGFGEGELDIKGPLSKPDVNGEIYLSSTYLFSEPYGIEMRFADDPVRIQNSKLLFENFEMFANNNSPLTITGNYDFSDLDNMTMDIRMRAQNFLLIDAKENPRSEAYGKAYVNFFGIMRGPMNNLDMRGKLDVLGSTDMTYVLKESELTTDNQLEELVKFTDLKDAKENLVVDRPTIDGFKMNMSISVDEAAHIVCALNAEHSNYIDLMGGGDLRMSYSASNLALTGRYTLSNGEMKYALPIIPLKTFHIKDGSYIEFTGDAFDPTLSITATEDIKASVNAGENNGRQVDFECGVKLSQTLNHMGIEFIISAPSDASVQDELNTKSTEERSKLAISMLASGMYLADGNTNSFSMNTALASFLNSEINNIAGNAMRTLGLDLGMTVDNSTNSAGALHTDYNFRFAKRFWNNRLSFIIGGKVSTGAELDQGRKDNNFFDNVELEYRLNKSASQYLRAFYDNSAYDWLEGPIGQYGVGFLWKRKLQHFKDIINFKSDDPVAPAPTKRNAPTPKERTDSTGRDSVAVKNVDKK